MGPERQALLAHLQQLVSQDAALGALEMRLRWREIDPEMLAVATQWAHQAAAMAQANAEARQMHDRVNAQMQALGFDSKPYVAAAPMFTGEQAQDANMLSTLLQQIAAHRGDPPTKPRLVAAAEDMLAGRANLKALFEASLRDDDVPPAQRQMFAAMLGVPGSAWLVHQVFGVMARLLAALALPRPRLVDAFAALCPDKVYARRVGFRAAMVEAEAVGPERLVEAKGWLVVAIRCADGTAEPDDDVKALHALLALPAEALDDVDVREAARRCQALASRVPPRRLAGLTAAVEAVARGKGLNPWGGRGRGGRSSSSTQPYTGASVEAERIFRALGGTLAAEALKGDYAEARRLAERWVQEQAATGDGASSTEAKLWLGIVQLLQGEPAAARRLFDEVERSAAGDATLLFRLASFRSLSLQDELNMTPDGVTFYSAELVARGRYPSEVQAAIHERDARGQGPVATWARREAAVIGGLVTGPRFYRGLPSAARRGVLDAEGLLQGFERGLAAVQNLRLEEEVNGSDLTAYADVVSADLCRRFGDSARARVFLERAEKVYAAANDKAGLGLCELSRADWLLTPLGSPLSHGLTLEESPTSGGEPSALERSEPPSPTLGESARREVSERLGRAANLFREGGAPRGEAAVRLREAYLTLLAGDPASAVRSVSAAQSAFKRAGDALGSRTARAHLVGARIAAGEAGIEADARAIGERSKDGGSISSAIGLGIWLTRLGHRWLNQSADVERSLRAFRAARALFDGLDARTNAAQSLVDEGDAYGSVGHGDRALACYERAADAYTEDLARREGAAAVIGQRTLDLLLKLLGAHLQRSDPDGIDRTAVRLRELDRISKVSGEATGVAYMVEHALTRAEAMGSLYRGQRAREEGDEVRARRFFDEAKRKAEAASEEERHFLLAVIAVEDRAWEEAAVAVRAYLDSRAYENALGEGGWGQALTEAASELKRGLEELEAAARHGAGNAAGMAEGRPDALGCEMKAGPDGSIVRQMLAQQLRRQHLASAFSLAVRSRAYSEAKRALDELETLGGAEWWRQQPRPWEPLAERAALHEGLGEVDAAVRLYGEAVVLLEAGRNRLHRDELKTAFGGAASSRSLYLRAARASLERDAAHAFDLAERGKARALLDLMAGDAWSDETPASDVPVFTAWRRQGAKVEVVRWLLSRARAAGGSVEAAKAESRLDDEEKALEAVEAQLTRERPDFFRAVSSRADTLGAAEVAAALPQGAILLEYFFAGDDLLAWAVERGGVVHARHTHLDTKRLGSPIRAFRKACQDGTADAGAGAELASALLGPFADILHSHERVIVVPHGASHALPFHALPFEGEPLGARRVVSYLPSASVLRFLRLDARASTRAIVAVGNPTGDLPGAEFEAQTLAKMHGAKALLGTSAGKAAVTAALSRASILHLATHGDLREDAPLLSSLRLAQNETLSVYELMGLDLNADLAVLSACDSGRGVTTGGDDVLGLTRGLLGAGVRSAIVSLWPVDDASTALLMAELYRRLAACEPVAHALAGAQRYLRGLDASRAEEQLAHLRDIDAPVGTPSAPRDYRLPFHWAPFVAIG